MGTVCPDRDRAFQLLTVVGNDRPHARAGKERTMPDVPLTAGSWAVGNTLRGYRLQAEMSAAAAAKAIGVSQPTITRIERGRHRLTRPQLAALTTTYDIPYAAATELERILPTLGLPDWRQDYGSLLDGPFGDVLGLETGASHIRAFDAQLPLGLLQTEEYAAALMQAAPYIRRSEVDRRVELRRRRQQGVLNGDQQLVAVIGEAAVQQLVGGAGVMARQVEHMIELSQLPNVMLRLLPFTAGATAATGASFTILDFPPSIDLPTVIAVDTLTSALIYEQPERVATYVQSFDMMWPFTCHEQATADRLAVIANAIREQG